MRRAVMVLALSTASPACAEDGWDRVKGMEIAWQALNAADFVTTQICLDRGTCHEANPLLGRHPSTEKLLAVKIGSGALHYAIARYAADRDPKAARIFEVVTITFQGGVVVSNLRFVF